jgi:hypothetical protein
MFSDLLQLRCVYVQFFPHLWSCFVNKEPRQVDNLVFLSILQDEHLSIMWVSHQYHLSIV